MFFILGSSRGFVNSKYYCAFLVYLCGRGKLVAMQLAAEMTTVKQTTWNNQLGDSYN